MDFLAYRAAPPVTPDELSAFLRRPVDERSAWIAVRTAVGSLLGATGRTELPSPLPEDMFGWILELAALLNDNPVSAATVTAGGDVTNYVYARRSEILAAAARAYSAAANPIGCFPEPLSWPT